MTLPVKSIPTLSVASRDEQRKFATNVSDTLVKVNYDDLVIRKCGKDMFNPRTIFESLEELAQSIKDKGLTHDIVVIALKSGELVIFDGERRYRAIGILRAQSAELKAKYSEIQVKLLKGTFTETELQLKILSTQASEHFHPLDEARAYERLMKGWMGDKPLKMAEIAVSVGKSIPYVAGRLKLIETTEEEKQLIESGKVSPTAMQHLVTKEADPVKRVAKIREANSKGKAFQVKEVKQSDLAGMAKEQIRILQDIQKWSKLDAQVIAWAQEVEGIARGILKIS